MSRLTDEKVKEYSKLKDASGKPFTTDHYECLIPMADTQHARFISVWTNTSNTRFIARRYEWYKKKTEKFMKDKAKAKAEAGEAKKKAGVAAEGEK